MRKCYASLAAAVAIKWESCSEDQKKRIRTQASLLGAAGIGLAWAYLSRDSQGKRPIDRLNEWRIARDDSYKLMTVPQAKAWEHALSGVAESWIGGELAANVKVWAEKHPPGPGYSRWSIENMSARELLDKYVLENLWPNVCRVCKHTSREPISMKDLEEVQKYRHPIGLEGQSKLAIKGTKLVEFVKFKTQYAERFKLPIQNAGSLSFFDLVSVVALSSELFGAAALSASGWNDSTPVRAGTTKTKVLRLVHLLMDRNGDGIVDATECAEMFCLCAFLGVLSLPSQSWTETWRIKFQQNKSSSPKLLAPNFFEEAFAKADTDHDGSLSFDELRDLLLREDNPVGVHVGPLWASVPGVV